MVYITGDCHGEAARLSRGALRLKKGDTLIVCGDFGFLWEGGRQEEKFLQKLGRRPYHICFIDGRHENYALLGNFPVSEFAGGRAQVISGNVVHLLRGELYTFEGETYFAFGGGESDDYDCRDEAQTWWPEEMPSEEELRRGLAVLEAAGQRVDYIVTHEPSGKACGRLLGRKNPGALQLYFNRIEDTVSFKRWFFGCLHLDRDLTARHRALYREVIPVNRDK